MRASLVDSESKKKADQEERSPPLHFKLVKNVLLRFTIDASSSGERNSSLAAKNLVCSQGQSNDLEFWQE